MTYSNVTDLIGLPQKLLTSGLTVVEYDLSNGNSMVIEYVVNTENEFVVLTKNYN
jgi:hypothetical protein